MINIHRQVLIIGVSHITKKSWGLSFLMTERTYDLLSTLNEGWGSICILVATETCIFALKCLWPPMGGLWLRRQREAGTAESSLLRSFSWKVQADGPSPDIHVYSLWLYPSVGYVALWHFLRVSEKTQVLSLHCILFGYDPLSSFMITWEHNSHISISKLVQLQNE